jgi:hypothetical protein
MESAMNLLFMLLLACDAPPDVPAADTATNLERRVNQTPPRMLPLDAPLPEPACWERIPCRQIGVSRRAGRMCRRCWVDTCSDWQYKVEPVECGR